MLLRLLRTLRRDDDGSALVAVLGLFAVAAIVTLVISSSTIHAMGFTTSTRAAVQAEAAAEAGVDYVVADLSRGNCTADYDNSAPQFKVTVSYSLQTTGDDWVDGCPGSSAARLRLLATGTAASQGVAGQSAGDTRVVEAVYAVTPANSQSQGVDAALYSFGNVTFDGSGTLQRAGLPVPNVYLKHGDADCTGTSHVAGNLVAADGNVTESGSCIVTGSVWASDALAISGGSTVGGNAIAGTDLTASGGTVYTTGHNPTIVTRTITGDAWAGNLMSLGDGSSVTNVTTKTLNVAGTKITGNAWASGSATFGRSDLEINGNLTAQSWSYPSYVTSIGNGSIVGGTATAVPAGPGAGPAAPAMPPVPDWLDYPYDPSLWPGFTVKVLSGTCDAGSLQSLADSFGGAPGIIDARSCPGITFSQYIPFTVSGDLAIFANSFTLSNGASVTTSTGPHKLWLITPDSTADGAPTCSGGASDTVVSGQFQQDPQITAMIYTPCMATVTASGNWYGQVYASTAELSGSGVLAYQPIELPGADMSAGTLNGNQATFASLLGTRLSVRDVSPQ